MIVDDGDGNEAWTITTLWQRYDGEIRANRVRVAAVVPFFIVHLVEHYAWSAEMVTAQARVFHIAITILVITWLLMAMAIEMALRNRFFPKFLGSFTTLVDLAIVTAMMSLGGGQSSPLVLAYPLIIGLSSLRMSLPLVYMATAGAIVGYGTLLVIGTGSFALPTGPIGVVPRYAQAMTILAILISGLIAGQLVRRIKVVADYYALRMTKELRKQLETDAAISGELQS